ncbi:MAG: hypothetical protein Ct9H300mP25_01590 [Acidobacteriota bacterium]|nr:MAG: hypothetical protein Ct9H300mP25_01590 [Acidobacteriota bacterium]
MTSVSTSFHRINADHKLSTWSKLSYLALNWLGNQFPYTAVDPALTIKDFRCDISDAQWRSLNQTSSPSRKLSDLFWKTLPWSKIKKELGSIHFLTAGVVTAARATITHWCHAENARYLGIDSTLSNQWVI